MLDVGCGIGTDAINFARAGADVTVVDISKKSLELCKKRFEVFSLKAKFILGNAEDLENKEKFDLIWAFGVIHHTPNPQKMLKQLANLLNEQGEIRAMVYSKISYKLFFLMRETGIWDFSKLDQLISEYSEAQSSCPITYTYTLEEAADLFSCCGLKIVSMRKAHIFTWKINEYKEHKYVREDCWKNVSESELKKLESELGWHILVKASAST